MNLNDFYFVVSFIPIFCALLLLQLVWKNCKLIGRVQLGILLAFSYYSICYSDYRFGFSVVVMTTIAYTAGLLIQKCKKYKRIFLAGGGIGCLAILGYFKYCNFFVDSISRLFGGSSVTLNIILPLGISFYSFTALGYMIDIYRGKYDAEINLLNFALFISFFPKVTAGPITRGDEFLPQTRAYQGITAENFEIGIQMFVFGLFKKTVLADHLGVFVDDVFFAPMAYHSLTVALAVISYALQIFFDFSGYSDMAVGLSRILGFHIRPNFDLPYIAENPSEFWNRWHISLSSWFRDYLYIPLGGNRKGEIRTYFNLLIVMLISGLWHGAGWTFVLWGVSHGIISCVHRAWCVYRPYGQKGAFGKAFRVISMFIVVSLLWVLFRASDITNAFDVYKSLFSFHRGIVQPYSWSFFAILVWIVYTTTMVVIRKDNVQSSDFYPALDLHKFWSLVLFFTSIGFTVMMGYYGNTAFLYGRF